MAAVAVRTSVLGSSSMTLARSAPESVAQVGEQRVQDLLQVQRGRGGGDDLVDRLYLLVMSGLQGAGLAVLAPRARLAQLALDGRGQAVQVAPSSGSRARRALIIATAVSSPIMPETTMNGRSRSRSPADGEGRGRIEPRQLVVGQDQIPGVSRPGPPRISAPSRRARCSTVVARLVRRSANQQVAASLSQSSISRTRRGFWDALLGLARGRRLVQHQPVEAQVAGPPRRTGRNRPACACSC